MVPASEKVAWRRLLFARGFALACACSFLLAIALGAAPALHDALHPFNGGADHACAVTIVQSGSCDLHVESLATHAPPALLCCRVDAWVIQVAAAIGDFARLEHAPPHLS